MNVAERFYVKKGGCIADRVNSANSGLARVCELDSTDQDHLRELVLVKRLDKLFEDLLFPKPLKLRDGSYAHEKWSDVSWILQNVLVAIGTSNLTKQKRLAQQHDRGRTSLRYDKIQNITSLALFAFDVEILLRDLYGKFEKNASNRIRHAIVSIMGTLATPMLVDLVNEHEDACTVDDGPGGLMALGYGLNSSESFEMGMAENRLRARAAAVSSVPDCFSKYTVRFVTFLYSHWLLKPKKEVHEDSDEEAFYEI
jgi:hypothetical protein